jgi:hypothetical protein
MFLDSLIKNEMNNYDLNSGLNLNPFLNYGGKLPYS